MLTLMLIISACGVYGNEPVPIKLLGPCPDPPAVANINTAKFSGVWYDVLHTSRYTALELQCDQIQFAAVNKTTLDFNSFTYDIDEERIISVLGTLTVIQNSGMLHVKIPSLSRNGNIRVLGIQYSTIAILWACKNVEDHLHEENLVVLTRDQYPGEDVMSEVNNLLLDMQLSTVKLQTTLQSNCQKYDFDSTTELNSLEGDVTSLAPLIFNVVTYERPMQDSLTEIFWEIFGYFLILYLFKKAPTVFSETMRYRIMVFSIMFIVLTVIFYFALL